VVLKFRWEYGKSSAKLGCILFRYYQKPQGTNPCARFFYLLSLMFEKLRFITLRSPVAEIIPKVQTTFFLLICLYHSSASWCWKKVPSFHLPFLVSHGWTKEKSLCWSQEDLANSRGNCSSGWASLTNNKSRFDWFPEFPFESLFLKITRWVITEGF